MGLPFVMCSQLVLFILRCYVTRNVGGILYRCFWRCGVRWAFILYLPCTNLGEVVRRIQKHKLVFKFFWKLQCPLLFSGARCFGQALVDLRFMVWVTPFPRASRTPERSWPLNMPSWPHWSWSRPKPFHIVQGPAKASWPGPTIPGVRYLKFHIWFWNLSPRSDLLYRSWLCKCDLFQGWVWGCSEGKVSGI